MLDVRTRVLSRIGSMAGVEADRSPDETPLLEGGALTSMKLVELCLSLEDLAAELGFEFDWTSEAAMSRARSMFRTAGALAAEFVAQMNRRT